MSRDQPAWRKALPKAKNGKGNLRVYAKWDEGINEVEVVFDYEDLPKELVKEIVSFARTTVDRERRRAEPLSEGVTVVHALRHGFALCKIYGLPREWPPGHQWVAADDQTMRKDITCAVCLRVLESENQELVDKRT